MMIGMQSFDLKLAFESQGTSSCLDLYLCRKAACLCHLAQEFADWKGCSFYEMTFFELFKFGLAERHLQIPSHFLKMRMSEMSESLAFLESSLLFLPWNLIF